MDVKLEGPVQFKVELGVFTTEPSGIDGFVQVKVPPVMVKSGIALSAATTAVAVLVQPFGPVVVRI